MMCCVDVDSVTNKVPLPFIPFITWPYTHYLPRDVVRNRESHSQRTCSGDSLSNALASKCVFDGFILFKDVSLWTLRAFPIAMGIRWTEKVLSLRISSLEARNATELYHCRSSIFCVCFVRESWREI